MRSLSGVRNQIVLVVVGVIALAAGAWLGAAAFGFLPDDSALVAAVPSTGETIGEVLRAHSGWLLPVASAVAVVAAIAGLALLALQIPTAPDRPVIRVTDSDGSVMAKLDAQVLERALAERMEVIEGIERATLRLSGTTGALRVQGEISITDGAELGWAVGQARRILFTDIQTALGVAPRGVDLLVSLHSGSSGRGDRDSVALRQDDRTGALIAEPA